MAIKNRLSRLLKSAKGKLPKTKLKNFALLAGVLFLLVTFFGGDYGFLRLRQLQKKKQALQMHYKQVQAEILQLELEKNLLQNDPFYIEKIAREKYGLSRPGERVYRFLPGPASSRPNP